MLRKVNESCKKDSDDDGEDDLLTLTYLHYFTARGSSKG